MAFDPSRSAEKWAKNFGGSRDEYVAGVQNCRVSPTERAADAAEKYADATAEAVRSGKYQRRLRAVSKASWQSSCIDGGASRLSSGATKGKAKMVKHLNAVKPFIDRIEQTVSGMPSGTEDAALDRVRANMRIMKEYSDSR